MRKFRRITHKLKIKPVSSEGFYVKFVSDLPEFTYNKIHKKMTIHSL